MCSFFYNSSNYDLFKKALRSTKNEPVIINILSDDSSLKESEGVNQNAQRKQMSSKFQASPFDKFFGPKKQRTDPLDMKDFSSWRNKNYRESEKQIDSAPEETKKFSFSDYLNSKTTNKFNSEDELKFESQKPIEQMSSKDENYEKFSLDSYLNKLEQQSKAQKDFAETDDLVKDFVGDDSVVKLDKNQDENFLSTSDVNVEDVAFGGEIKGEKFAFDREELDSVRARLDKMEREANNIKDKPTTKVISTNELSDIAKSDEDDEFNLDKLGIEDDIEKVNKNIESQEKNLQVTGDDETKTPKVEHKRFVEINKSFEESEQISSVSGESLVSDEDLNSVNINDVVDTYVVETEDVTDESNSLNEESGDKGVEDGVVKPVIIDGATANPEELKDEDELDEEGQNSFVDVVEMIDETDANSSESLSVDEIQVEVDTEELGAEESLKTEIKKSDEILTKTDLRTFTDEIVNKFSELSRGNNQSVQGGNVSGVYGTPAGTEYVDGQGYMQHNPNMMDNPYNDVNIDGQNNVVGFVGSGQAIPPEYQKKQDELQAQLMELIEQNKRTDEEVAKKLEMAEKEKMRVAEEYENRLRELESSMQKREEAVKQQAYIEKLKNDIKLKKSESKYRLREEQIRESEKSNSQALLDCEKLKSELRNSLSVSNLEMDKKLLECVNRLHKVEIEKQEQRVEELSQDLKEEIEKPTKTRTSQRRRSSTVRSRMRTRTPRRKIDSDIIGGINFD